MAEGNAEREHAESVVGVLPTRITRLLGREEAVAELSSLIWGARALSLCGPGGIGKTRLALALAEAVREDFVGGAWWVDLSSTLDPASVARVVAGTLLPDAGFGDPWPALTQALSDSTLLVLDNCEQVVGACAELVARLLERAPGVRVVATSRQPLHVPGERVWRVAGLDECAVDLFVDRAREASSVFAASAPGTREAVDRICRLLDGMPLAIELAAARVSVLGVQQIAERLERSSGVLGHGPSVAPERHQTLRAALDWSYRLLTEPERQLFRRLAPFPGGFSLMAAETICADQTLSGDEILELLSRLVDQSLIDVEHELLEPRYRLLASVRHYATEKLDANAEEALAIRRRHAAYFHALALAERPGGTGPDHLRRLQILELERDNLSQALSWHVEHAPASAVTLALSLWPFWYQRGFYSEARRWFEQIHAAADEIPAADRAEFLMRLGEVAFLQCDYAVAAEHLERVLTLIDENDDPRTTAAALQRLGSIAREQGRYAQARELHRRSLRLWEALGDATGVAASHNYLGFVEWLAGEPAAGRELCEIALVAFEQLGEVAQTASTLINLGACRLYGGEFELAGESLERALALSRRIGFEEGIAWALHELAILGRRRRRSVIDNLVQLREALAIHLRLGDRWRAASVLEEIAAAGLARTDQKLAVELLAAVDAHRHRLGTPVPPAEAADRDATVTRLRSRLGPPVFAAAWADGTLEELDAIIPRVLGVLAVPESEDDAAPGHSLIPTLTGRELDVLRLVSDGHTNAEIAAALYISPSTAGVHVSNILRKLGAKRRIDAAGIAHQLGLLTVA
jgi:predicted ATPase/DNA-binding CsgD family transcriptional regulator